MICAICLSMASRPAIASPRPEPDQRVLYTQSAVIEKFTIRTADFKGIFGTCGTQLEQIVYVPYLFHNWGTATC
jgi:hypothetical protein